MDKINLGEWFAVLSNGEWWCGKRAEAPRSRTLSSLQKLSITMGVRETNQGLRPVISALTFPWLLDSLDIPEGALWISVTAFTDQAPWAEIIAKTEALKLENRTNRIGLHLAR